MGNEVMTGRLDVDAFFELDKILDGTQSFRWRHRDDGWYSGVLQEHLVHVRQGDGGLLEYKATSDVDGLLRSYFRLDEDIEATHKALSRHAQMAELVEKYRYLRLLRQPDPWECTVSYICSANNSVAGIIRRVGKIAELGCPVVLDGEKRRIFPTAEQVRDAGTDALRAIGLGLKRDEKILGAAERVCEGSLKLDELAQPDVCYAEATRRLRACYGIGDKVADCIALFALNKTAAFPVDIHVHRAIDRHFPDAPRRSAEELGVWAEDYFGKHAGYANQLLWRESFEASKGTGASGS